MSYESVAFPKASVRLFLAPPHYKFAGPAQVVGPEAAWAHDWFSSQLDPIYLGPQVGQDHSTGRAEYIWCVEAIMHNEYGDIAP